MAGLEPLPHSERARILELVSGAMVSHSLGDGDISWALHRGENLTAAEQQRLAQDPAAIVRAALSQHELPPALARKLATDVEHSVRLALALALAEGLDSPRPRISATQRHEIAELLWREGDGEIKDAVFTALTSERQVAHFKEDLANGTGSEVDWVEVARGTRSIAMMRALLAHDDQYDLQGALADNLALPEDLQVIVVERAKKRGKKCATCWLHESPMDVVTALVMNENASPAALVAASRLALLRPLSDLATELTSRTDLPLEALELLHADWRGSEDWSLAVLINEHSTRSMIEAALRPWFEDDDITKAVRRLHGQQDDAWFEALSASQFAELREVAATNVNTPPHALAALVRDPVADVRIFASYNPSLPKSARPERLGEEIFLPDDLDALARLAGSPSLADRRAARERYSILKNRSW